MNDFSPAPYDLLFYDLPFFGMACSAYEGWAETAPQRAAGAAYRQADAGFRPVFPLSACGAQELNHE